MLSLWILNLVKMSSFPGVWKSSHIQTWSNSYWRCQGTWRVLHHPLCWYLRGYWHASAEFLSPTTRGIWNYGFFINLSILLCFQILSKDSVTVFVNAIMYYKVQDAIKAITNVDDYAGSAQALAATTLRNVLGTRTLGDILSDRVKIASEMQVERFMKKCKL